MVHGKLILAAAILATGATSASAIDVNSAAAIGSNAMGEHVRAFPAGRTHDPDQVLKQLNRVCASKNSFDRRRCANAWRIIDDAHAKLQAKRAAEAVAAGAAEQP